MLSNSILNLVKKHILKSPQDSIEKSHRLAIFGPGIESRVTKEIIQNLIASNFSDFKFVNFVPGSSNGIGSGIRIDFQSMLNFDLICLYSNVKRLRMPKPGVNARLFASSNKLLKRDAIPIGENAPQEPKGMIIKVW